MWRWTFQITPDLTVKDGREGEKMMEENVMGTMTRSENFRELVANFIREMSNSEVMEAEIDDENDYADEVEIW